MPPISFFGILIGRSRKFRFALSLLQSRSPTIQYIKHGFWKTRWDYKSGVEDGVFTATFEFPGVSKENIQIDVHNNRFTVSAETKQLENFKESGYAVGEGRFGKLSRTVQLPQRVKDELIRASMNNGVLTVIFPKTTGEQAPKRIPIS